MNCHSVLRLPESYAAAVHQTQPRGCREVGVNAGTRVSFSYDGNTVTLRLKSPKG